MNLPDWAKREIKQLEYEIKIRQDRVDQINKQATKGTIQPDHMCGLMGFNPMLGDTCPACEWRGNQ